ncbi:transporter substrate-binding domain-containing protein [Endozoicomonas sp. SM1973]|uniref:Transporter substrate-binding domain-containing protein n=1 Tax=Spartinivicinus marinus TaxID=2994442 RepID=A0A853IA15_9GAMM|nr:transporter substrate-binding domain-containing protein [Spartinivicinus marinus]MCX4029832.1 transporter substrate-binding domain-containing protein [Spartinivicinus marinus]NYZ67498.1 transporter substrate-binding domain-containing protein [Spartinivicinus marinus]
MLISRLKTMLLMGLLLLGNHVNSEGLDKLTFITESYPPYNFENSGILRGISVDLLVAAAQKVSQPVTRNKIKLYPWARGYRNAVDGPNIVLFATTRTEEREPLFKWAGPITATRIVLLAPKASNISIKSPEDLKKYKIAAIRDDVGEQLVVALGIEKGKIKSSANADSVVKKLANNKVDMWAYEENVARWFIKKNNLNNDDYATVYVLKEAELYYAFSKDVSDTVVASVQEGIDKVKAAPGKVGKTLYDDIMSEYM